jgi:hypothetical protein
MRYLRAAVLLSVIAASVVPLMRIARQAWRGPFDDRLRDTALAIDRQLPRGEPIAVIGQTPDHWDALFVDYYVYPRTARWYRDLGAYRLDAKHPKTLVYVTDRARVLPYEAIRAEQMQGAIAAPHLAPGATHFYVPFVASADGVPPAVYTTEAVFRSASKARVTAVLHPQQLVKTWTIDRNASFVDFVHEVFGVLNVGWLEVTSDVPLEASFAFVNRGAKKAAPLPIISQQAYATLHVTPGQRLWLVNLRGDPNLAVTCGYFTRLAPFEMYSRVFDGHCDVGGAYPFATEKLRDGSTRFTWPETSR